MKKLISLLSFLFLFTSVSFGQHYLNEDYSNPYFEIGEVLENTLTIYMERESTESFACDDFRFICTKNKDGNFYYYFNDDGDNKNVIIIYANPLNEEQMPTKIVVKSTTYEGHFCDLAPATYVFEPLGD